MTAFLDAVFTGVFGVPVTTVLGLLMVSAIRGLSRHSILLHGSVSRREIIRQHNRKGAINQKSAPGMSRFRFRLQNLEEVSYPSEFDISIVGKRPASSLGQSILVVTLYAGPQKMVVLKHGSDDLTAGGATDSNLVEWSAKFDSLPAYDAWLFDCESNCDILEFTINREKVGNFLTRPFRIDLAPSRLVLSSGTTRTRYSGKRATPPYWVFGLIALSAVLAFTVAIRPNITDWVMQAICDIGIVFALWVGFWMIRRPVYPIIQGYLAVTYALDLEERTSGQQHASEPMQVAGIRDESVTGG